MKFETAQGEKEVEQVLASEVRPGQRILLFDGIHKPQVCTVGKDEDSMTIFWAVFEDDASQEQYLDLKPHYPVYRVVDP